MHLLAALQNPAFIAILALVLAVVWMLRDETDKTRPLLVIALTVNLFYGFFLTFFMGREGALLPWKYDHVLFRIDAALGLPAYAIAQPLQGPWRTALTVVYQLMVPMMIAWFLVLRSRTARAALVLTYVAELITGPLLYVLLPACGPIYAFGAQWLDPPPVDANAIRLAGMPNAFPSLHIGTAFVLVLFAPGRVWRVVALAFLVGTALATLSTGEHYVIDLAAGLIFGCFAASLGCRRYRAALVYLAVVIAWSFSIRFASVFLLDHPAVVRIAAALTVLLAVVAAVRQGRACPADEFALTPSA